jgi:hypothetical protein
MGLKVKFKVKRIKYFIRVVIVMAYVFNLFYVVTVMCNGGSCF